MKKLSRRSMVKAGAASLALGAIPLPKWLQTTAYAGPPLIRYNAYSTEGKAMLAQYAQAINIMKQRAEGDPCSWTFQWFTHWVRGDSTKAAQVASLPAMQQALANDMWDTCQNHGGFTTEDMFLPWHRLYILHFERIVRRTLDDPTWTLPYWNYNDASQASLPTEFLNPGNASNPLWVKNRNAGPNSGMPLTGLTLDALQQTSYSGFCATLDFGLHGNVHVEVGDGLNMGAVPWAANDPVFWMHHSNIDRLWASWNAGGFSNPTSSSWSDQSFVFADECCERVVARVGDCTRIEPLHYAYDRLEPVGKVVIRWPWLLEALKGRPLLTKGPGPVELGAQEARVPLRPPEGDARFSVQERLRSLGTERRLFLVVGGLHAMGTPGVVYDIYLNLKEGIAGREAEAHRAGIVNFFAADMPPGSKEMGDKPGLVFDVTEVLQNLDSANALGRDVTVTITPNGKPNEKAKASLGELSLIEQ